MLKLLIFLSFDLTLHNNHYLFSTYINEFIYETYFRVILFVLELYDRILKFIKVCKFSLDNTIQYKYNITYEIELIGNMTIS